MRAESVPRSLPPLYAPVLRDRRATLLCAQSKVGFGQSLDGRRTSGVDRLGSPGVLADHTGHSRDGRLLSICHSGDDGVGQKNRFRSDTRVFISSAATAFE
jgi:hypothetical protein